MERAREAEFEAFVAEAGSRLLRTAFLLTGDRGHAEDLVQTALERTARRWTRLSGSAEAFARTVLVREAIDQWRRRRVRVREIFGDAPEPAIGDASNEIAQRRDLLVALRQLTPNQRALLVLRFFVDLSETETARDLGISVGAVKSGTSRALDRLRTVIGDKLTKEACL